MGELCEDGSEGQPGGGGGHSADVQDREATGEPLWAFLGTVPLLLLRPVRLPCGHEAAATQQGLTSVATAGAGRSPGSVAGEGRRSGLGALSTPFRPGDEGRCGAAQDPHEPQNRCVRAAALGFPEVARWWAGGGRLLGSLGRPGDRLRTAA